QSSDGDQYAGEAAASGSRLYCASVASQRRRVSALRSAPSALVAVAAAILVLPALPVAPGKFYRPFETYRRARGRVKYARSRRRRQRAQESLGLALARVDRPAERRALPQLVADVGTCPALDEEREHVQVLVERRLVQRRAVLVHRQEGVDVGA